MTGTDFYPTLLAMAGLPSRAEQHVDGVSLVPLLQGGSIAARPLFWHYPHYGNQGGEPSSILQEQNWKLIHYYEDGRNELYDLGTDPSEQVDRVQSRRERLLVWLDETGATKPAPNPKFDEAAYCLEQQRTRERTLPNLEAQAAEFLSPSFTSPRGDWWGSAE